MAIREKIDPTKLFQVVLIAFVVIQGISFVLSELDVFPIIKGGWFLLLILTLITLTTLFTLGKNITQLEIKKNLVFIVLVFGLIILAFVYLPTYLPQIFSSASIDIGETVRESSGTIGQNIGAIAKW